VAFVEIISMLVVVTMDVICVPCAVVMQHCAMNFI
jgi:hypothetical protein